MHVDDALAHQRGEPDRRAAVIGEHQERAGIGDDAAMQRHAVHRGGHAVLADAVVDEAAGEIGGRHRLHRLGARVVGAGEIGRAADHFRHRRHQRSRARIREACARGDVLRRRRRAFPSRAAPPRASACSAARRPCGARIRRACRRRARRAACPRRACAPFERCAGLAPGGRMSAGTSNGASVQPSFSRAPLISSAPSGEPCDVDLPALVGAP